MKCNHCGAEIADDSVFCEHCGKKIGEENTPGNSSKKKFALWIGISVAVVVAIVLTVVLLGGGENRAITAEKDSLVEEAVAAEQVEEIEAVSGTTRSNNAEMVYQYSGEFYCDGVYDDAHGFHTPELNINRNHFEIDFSFKVTQIPSKGEWPIILSHSYRILGLYLENDRLMYISTNNQENYYPIGKRYPIDEYVDINMEYNHGILTLNGQQFYIDMTTDGYWDNAFHSINYSNGTAFKGYLKDVTIFSYSD